MSDKILHKILFPGILLLIVLTGGCMKQGVPLYYHTLSSPEQPEVSSTPNELPLSRWVRFVLPPSWTDNN